MEFNYNDDPNPLSLPSINEPSNISIEITERSTSSASKAADTLAVAQDDYGVGLSQENLSSHDQGLPDVSIDLPKDRIKSWIQDVPLNEALPTGELAIEEAGTSKAWEDEVAERDDNKDKFYEDDKKFTNRLEELMNRKSFSDLYKPKGMSTEGRYQAVPNNQQALSKLGLDVIAKKLSLQIAQASEGRSMGSGSSEKPLKVMANRRRSSLPAGSDSYVQLMNSRSKSRGGGVPSATSVTSSSGSDQAAASSTSASSKSTATSSLLKKVTDKAGVGGLNFKALTNLRMMIRRAVKSAFAAENFAKDEIHLKFIRETAETINVTIPVPIKISMYQKVLPVLHDTCKAYNSKLGPKHQMTRQAVDKYDLYMKHLDDMIKTMG